MTEIVQPKMRTVRLSELHPFGRNPRQISDGALEGLDRSLHKFGLVEPIVWNERTGRVVGGHQRLKILLEAGAEATDVVVVDLPEEDEKALNIVLNNPATAGEYDDQLEGLLDEIETYIGDDFEALHLDELRESMGPEDTNEDEPPPLPDRPKTRSGDLIELGVHRLACGDCRDTTFLSRLFAGDAAHVVFTSPPYADRRVYDEGAGFEPILPDAYVAWYEDVAASIAEHLADSGSYFLNIKAHCKDGQRVLYVHDLVLAHARAWGWRFVDELCWQRVSLPGSYPNRFKNGWEPVFHFSRGETIKFRPANVHKQHMTSDASLTTDEIVRMGRSTGFTEDGSDGGPGSVRSKNFDGALPSNVLQVSGVQRGVGHTAAFPVGLPSFFVRAFSDEGDVIFDPFMGSGTTLVAAHKEGRRGFGVELSPAYCDVAIERWRALGGSDVVVVRDGARLPWDGA